MKPGEPVTRMVLLLRSIGVFDILVRFLKHYGISTLCVISFI